MGSVALPQTGRVYVDASVLIYSVERHPDHARMLRRFWTAVAAASVQAVTSELSILETTVLPLRNGDEKLVATYEAMLARPEIEVRAIDRGILREAARLRAAVRSLRTPDASHVATAKLADCEVMLTNDASLKQLSEIRIVLAKDAAGGG